MVVLGSGLVLMVTIGPMGSFGLIFGAFLDNIGAGTSDVTFINGLFFALALLPGVLANRLLQLYTCRQVTIVGGLFFFFGCFLSSFSNGVAYMVITFSIIQGTGLGLLLPASFTCINHYFLRKRTLAMGAAQLMAAVGVMLYPLLIETLLENYGFRGTQAILAALSLNTLVGAMTMKPLDSSVLLLRRKTFERSIENQLRRKSIISIRSVRLKLDNEGSRRVSIDDSASFNYKDSSKSEEMPLREGLLQFSTNYNMIPESILEEAEEEEPSETQPILKTNSNPGLSENKDSGVETKNQADSYVKIEVTSDEVDPSSECTEDENLRDVSSLEKHFDINSEKLHYIDEDVQEQIHSKESHVPISVGDAHDEQNNQSNTQRNCIVGLTNDDVVQEPIHSNESQVEISLSDAQDTENNQFNMHKKCVVELTNDKTPILPKKQFLTNSMSNDVGELENYIKENCINPTYTVLNCSSVPTGKFHDAEANTMFNSEPRVEAHFTIGDEGVTLNVPSINVTLVPNRIAENNDKTDAGSIRRCHSANILGNTAQRTTQIPSTGSYNDLERENQLHQAPSLTAFTRDYPNYKKTFERTSRGNRYEYLCYPVYMDSKFHTISGRRNERVISDKDIIKCYSATSIPHVRSKTKLSVAFSDRPNMNSGDRYYSGDCETDPHRVHPCFYENTRTLVAGQHGSYLPDDEETSPTRPLLKTTQTPNNASAELLTRLPGITKPEKRRPSAMTTSSARSSRGRSDSDSSVCLGSYSEESHSRANLRSRRQSVISWTADCLDLELLKDHIYVNIIVGVSFSLFSDNMFFNLQPLYYLALGYSAPQVALCIAINSAADLVGRLTFVLCSFCLTYKSRVMFLLASAATIVFRIGFLVSTDYLVICVLTALLGFFRSWINVCIPLIFAEFSPVDRFPAAYGLHLLSAGLLHLLVGPFVGLIRDVTGSYIICLGTVTGCLLFCVIPWIGEAVVFRFNSVFKFSS